MNLVTVYGFILQYLFYFDFVVWHLVGKENKVVKNIFALYIHVCVTLYTYIYIYLYIAYFVSTPVSCVGLCTSNFRMNVSINFVILLLLDRLFIFYECEFITISNIVYSSVLALTVL